MYSIYKIEHRTNPELVYVGSTKKFNKRKREHKCASRTNNQKVYQMIREHGGWEQFDMVEIKQIECTQLEARQEEDSVRIELNAQLNTLSAILDIENRKKKKNQYAKQYKETHREEYLQKNKEPYTCGCGSQITRGVKARHLRTEKHIEWASI